MLRSRKGLLIALSSLAVLLAPAGVGAQARTVISKEVSVGESGAMLHLGFAHGKPLQIALHDGSVVIDGQTVGSYKPADALDSAWRTLLGKAVSLDDGALAAMLRDWSPPADLKGGEAGLAGRIATALHGAFTKSAAPAPKPGVSLSVGQDRDQGAVLQALLSQADKLGLLRQAMAGVGTDVRLHVDEDVNVASGETVKGSLVAVECKVRVAGTVDGDIVAVGGSLELAKGSRVTGDVRLADARLQRDGGSVEGTVVHVSEGESETSLDSATRARIRSQVRDELRNEMLGQIRHAARTHASPAASLLSPFRHVFQAVGGLIEDAVTIFVLALIGMGVVAFAGDKLDAVAETARQAPGRAALVGLAGTFLLVPVWVIGAVALAVSIVGIPVMIAWLPLFPLAAVAAALLGYLAVARNVGEWLADSDYRYTGWIRRSNPVYTIVGGLVALAAFFIAAHVLALVPFLGFVRGLLVFVGVMFGIAATQIGFGAVLLTRGGRRRGSYPGAYDADWEPDAAVEFDGEGGPTPGDVRDGQDAGDLGDTPDSGDVTDAHDAGEGPGPRGEGDA